MPIVLVHKGPTLTRERYEQVAKKLTGGRDRMESLSDWPVEGIISHIAGEGPDGFMVIDVWESQEAFESFGETIGPLLQEAGVEDPPQFFEPDAFVKS